MKSVFAVLAGLAITFALSKAARAQTTAAPVTGTAATEPVTPGTAPESAKDNNAPNDGSIKMAKVFFVEPKDGATVAKEFHVKFGVSGYKVGKAGDMTPGVGHHHLLIDSAATPKGEIVGTDAKHLHFGGGQTETSVKLLPGPHTLTLQFADGAHRSYGPSVSQTIKIIVK
jgi:hypothetical protein